MGCEKGRKGWPTCAMPIQISKWNYITTSISQKQSRNLNLCGVLSLIRMILQEMIGFDHFIMLAYNGYLSTYFCDSFLAAVDPNQGVEGYFFYDYVKNKTTLPMSFYEI